MLETVNKVKPTESPEQQDLIDSITYLASLASDMRAIDRQLDTLRIVTAGWQPPNPLKNEDILALQKLHVQLKDYLINHDPLRDFTAETLEARMHAHLQAKKQPAKTRFKVDFKAAVFISAIPAAATMAIPSSPSIGLRVLLAVPLFLLGCSVFNTWFYLSALRGFKQQIRQAFMFLCAGAIGVSVQFIHFILISLLGQEQLPLYRYGGFTIIAGLSLFAMYLGLRKYARALGTHNPFARFLTVAGVCLLVILLAVAGAYVSPGPDKGYLAFSLASTLFVTGFAFCNFILSNEIVQRVTDVYAKSMRGLRFFSFFVSIAAVGYASVVAWQGELYGVGISIALAVFATPPLLLLMYSGYSFKAETGR